MSQMNIKFIIKGLAICYHKDDGVWRIIFPFDEDHIINFTLKKTKILESAAENLGEFPLNRIVKEETTFQSISLAAANRRISIETVNALIPDKLESGDFSEFIDMTANYSHFNGVKLKDNWQERGVLMTLPNATLFMEKSTLSSFILAPQNLSVGVDLGTIGEVVGGNVSLDSAGGCMVLKIADDNIVPPIDFEENASYELIFDNDCATLNGVGKEDFPHYYELLEDVESNDLIFDANVKLEKTVSIESETNPLILCGGVRISKTSHPSFP